MGSPKQGQRSRALRVNIPGKESAVIDIGGRRITGLLCQLSVNGGSLRLPKIFGENTFGQITLQTTTGNIESAIQFLKSGAPDVQAFRFVQLDPPTRSRLDTALKQMHQGVSGEESRSMLRFCTNAARRVMQKAKNHIEKA
jgi:hypothetical protein